MVHRFDPYRRIFCNPIFLATPMPKRAVLFDFDGTLADSRTPDRRKHQLRSPEVRASFPPRIRGTLLCRSWPRLLAAEAGPLRADRGSDRTLSFAPRTSHADSDQAHARRRRDPPGTGPPWLPPGSLQQQEGRVHTATGRCSRPRSVFQLRSRAGRRRRSTKNRTLRCC